MNQNPGANPFNFVQSAIPQGQVLITQSPATDNPSFLRYQIIIRRLAVSLHLETILIIIKCFFEIF